MCSFCMGIALPAQALMDGMSCSKVRDTAFKTDVAEVEIFASDQSLVDCRPIKVKAKFSCKPADIVLTSNDTGPGNPGAGSPSGAQEFTFNRLMCYNVKCRDDDQSGAQGREDTFGFRIVEKPRTKFFCIPAK